MDKVFEKLEIYSFINYLLPGVIFSTIYSKIVGETFINSDLVVAIFEYFFVGLVISRIGSLLLCPILEKTKFIEFAKYDKFIKASKKDEKIEILQREANQYRTYIVVSILLELIQIVECIANKKFSLNIIMLLGLIILFLFSYKKQILFIKKRIEVS